MVLCSVAWLPQQPVQGHGKGRELWCCMPAAMGECFLLGVPWESALYSPAWCFGLPITPQTDLFQMQHSGCEGTSQEKSRCKHLQSHTNQHIWGGFFCGDFGSLLCSCWGRCLMYVWSCAVWKAVSWDCLLWTALAMISAFDFTGILGWLLFLEWVPGVWTQKRFFFFKVDYFSVSLYMCVNMLHVWVHPVIYQRMWLWRGTETFFFFWKTKCPRKFSTGRINFFHYIYLMVSTWSLQEPALIGGYCSVHFNISGKVLLSETCRNKKPNNSK